MQRSGVEKLAIVVFERAQQTGEPVTMALVKQVTAELGEATARNVYRTALGWERSVAATRRRARA